MSQLDPSPRTLSHQLIQSIREEIQLMKPGDRLPSERQLCDIYKVSRTTVRSAIADLELNGYIKRIQGKGTFVQVPSRYHQNLQDYYSFTEQTKKQGKVPESLILEFHIEKPNQMTQEMLNLSEEDNILRFLRLRKADGIPMMLETTFLNYAEFPGLTLQMLETTALYTLFEQTYHKNIERVKERYSVAILNRQQAELLDVPSNDPCLKITRMSFDANHNIIEYTISFARGDKFNYETEYYPNHEQ